MRTQLLPVALALVVAPEVVTWPAAAAPGISRCTITCRSYPAEASREPNRGWLQHTCQTGPSWLQEGIAERDGGSMFGTFGHRGASAP
jgi:hypothetical protein